MFKNRNEHGGLNLINDLRFQENLNIFVRVVYSDFKYLVSLNRPQQANHMFKREPISVDVEERLTVTIRFLATGDSYNSLQRTFKISKSTVHNMSSIIPDVCITLTKVLSVFIKVRIKSNYLDMNSYI